MDKKNLRLPAPRSLSSVLWTFVALCLLTVSCAPRPDFARGASLTLTTFSESGVAVAVQIQRSADGQVSLVAVLTPTEAGFHLYSKDMPRNGVNGLGRPTLIELGPNSKMQSIGALTESVGSNISSADPPGILIYPDGPVTLFLPVHLPPGNGLVADEISLTYMSCSANACRAPVMGKVIPVQVPGADALTN